MFQDINVDQLMKVASEKGFVMIDVRSPSEYKDATIAGSVNIPLFTDEERAEIGTIYTRVSSEAAKERGLEIVSAKLPAFVQAFNRIEGPKAVFCWRGGMRSKTTATILSLMDIHVHRISGGYRAYRNWVMDRLAECSLPSKVYVINGNTGAGKTAILNVLEAKGYPVLDLEGLAGHRGSIFGEIGLQARNQKTFDSLLVHRMNALKDAKYMLIEGESNRIGKVILPQFIMDGKARGEQIVIDMPLSRRIQHIINDYNPVLYKQEYLTAFAKIKRKIHTPIAREIETNLINDQYDQAVGLLLEHYYDPRYKHAIAQYDPANPIVIVKVNQIEEAIAKIEAYIESEIQLTC